MPVMNIRRTLLILVVGVLTPSMDQVSDLRLVIRLMSGPEGSTHLQSGIKNLEEPMKIKQKHETKPMLILLLNL